jgi:hypothetical protein
MGITKYFKYISFESSAEYYRFQSDAKDQLERILKKEMPKDELGPPIPF